MCEDYRAAATIDFEMDTRDFEAGNKVKCPVLVTWGSRSHVEQHFSPREAWPQYASDIRGFVPLPAGHYPQEQAPEIARALAGILSGVRVSIVNGDHTAALSALAPLAEYVAMLMPKRAGE